MAFFYLFCVIMVVLKNIASSFHRYCSFSLTFQVWDKFIERLSLTFTANGKRQK